MILINKINSFKINVFCLIFFPKINFCFIHDRKSILSIISKILILYFLNTDKLILLISLLLKPSIKFF